MYFVHESLTSSILIARTESPSVMSGQTTGSQV